MPTSAPHACQQPGCPNKIRHGAYCDQHRRRRAQQRRHDHHELAFYNTARWRRFCAWFKARHPLCERCKKQGRLTPTEHVDHVIPRSERPDLEYDEGNCQGLCRSCHSTKTLEDRYRAPKR